MIFIRLFLIIELSLCKKDGNKFMKLVGDLRVCCGLMIFFSFLLVFIDG